jgi:protein TonB
MFEYSFVPSGRTRRPLLAAVACVGEAALFGGLILISLFFGQTLPEHTLFSALMLAPVPTAPPSPPPPMAAAKKIPRAAPAPRMFTAAGLVSPVVVPKVVAIINEAPALDMEAVVGGVPGGIPGVPGGTGSFSNVLSVAPPPPPPPPKAAVLAPPPPPPTPTQISVGGDVQAALIVQQVQPVYPRLARQGHIHGTVELKAVIGTDGRIKDLKVLSGHPLLVEAAMNAVRRWVYRPTILNGVPVEVNTEIEVRFGLTART